MTIEISQSDFRRMSISKLNKCFPDLSFLKDEDLDNFSMLAKKLVKVIVSNDVSEFIIDTDK